MKELFTIIDDPDRRIVYAPTKEDSYEVSTQTTPQEPFQTRTRQQTRTSKPDELVYNALAVVQSTSSSRSVLS